MTIKVKSLEDAARHYDVLAARIDLAIAEALRDGLPPILIKQRLTLAANRILSTIEEGGDAFGEDRSHARHDTSPGVTAGAVDPSTIRAEALREAADWILGDDGVPVSKGGFMVMCPRTPSERAAAILALIDKEKAHGR